jgi:cytochrome c oxidase cbb3-type subunit III
MRRALASCLASVALACGGAEPARVVPAAGGTAATDTLLLTSDLAAGGARADPAIANPYADDPRAVAAGRALYASMNCAGCHGPAGGGGIGPPLADAEWIYGGQPEDVVETVLRGRPNGMPSFGGRLPRAEAWKVAAYVLTLSAAAGRREQPSVSAR